MFLKHKILHSFLLLLILNAQIIQPQDSIHDIEST
jgi:hypothetical protein